MAARLGVDHERLKQFITSSTWDHVLDLGLCGSAGECRAVVRGQPCSRLSLAMPGQYLLIRRLMSRPDQMTYYLCWAPRAGRRP